MYAVFGKAFWPNVPPHHGAVCWGGEELTVGLARDPHSLEIFISRQSKSRWTPYKLARCGKTGVRWQLQVLHPFAYPTNKPWERGLKDYIIYGISSKLIHQHFLTTIFHQKILTENLPPNIFHKKISACLLIVWISEFRTVLCGLVIIWRIWTWPL